MLGHALAADAPFSWCRRMPGYGRDPQLRAWRPDHAVPYVFGVPVDLPLDGPPGKPRQPVVKHADDLLRYAKTCDQWERRSLGDGAKGGRIYSSNARRLRPFAPWPEPRLVRLRLADQTLRVGKRLTR
ncbi:hypothetical protein [Streptomyces atratus]|uniref:hypothetical protein n=1 Tax=Streptomyces atratus TaxID=1893 RepID=UPI0037BD0563